MEYKHLYWTITWLYCEPNSTDNLQKIYSLTSANTWVYFYQRSKPESRFQCLQCDQILSSYGTVILSVFPLLFRLDQPNTSIRVRIVSILRTRTLKYFCKNKYDCIKYLNQSYSLFANLFTKCTELHTVCKPCLEIAIPLFNWVVTRWQLCSNTLSEYTFSNI